jgi:hypothetical protein
MLHLIVEMHLCDVLAFVVMTTLSRGGERPNATWILSLLTRMRRWQLVCASVGGLIKTMSPPLDLRVLMNKIEFLSMTTIQSTSVT